MLKKTIILLLLLCFSFTLLAACKDNKIKDEGSKLEAIVTQEPLPELSKPSARVEADPTAEKSEDEAAAKASEEAGEQADESDAESDANLASESKEEAAESDQQTADEAEKNDQAAVSDPAAKEEQEESAESTAPLSPEEIAKEELTEPKRLIPNEEKVPLSQVDPDLNTGVVGHLTQQFFELVSSDPLYFSYREWSVAKKDEEAKQIQEMLLLLSTDRVYLKLQKDGAETIIVKPANSAFYLLDRESYAAVKIDVESKVAKQISAYAFAQLNANAQKLVFTGSGESEFHGQKAVFEEFRNGRTGYVRYYFSEAGVPLGHRIIEKGKLVSDIEIIELKNEIDERFFEIPAIYEIIND
ncbi:MAG: hypothetical protein Q4P08_03830 [Eubacteriales bacterium]|nr:hypothetical protein [Eubacteriales bacterium]